MVTTSADVAPIEPTTLPASSYAAVASTNGMPRGSGATVSVAASGSYWSVPAAAGRRSPAPRYSVLFSETDTPADDALQ